MIIKFLLLFSEREERSTFAVSLQALIYLTFKVFPDFSGRAPLHPWKPNEPENEPRFIFSHHSLQAQFNHGDFQFSQLVYSDYFIYSFPHSCSEL